MKKFSRWYFTNDTPRWKRAAFNFLMVVTVAVGLALLVWWIW